MTAVTVLAVASEIFPLIKTGGPGRRGGRAAAGAGGGGRPDHHPGPRLSRGAARPDRSRRRCTDSRTCSAARRGCCAERAAGLDLLAIDAPHLYARPGGPYIGPDGRDWPDNRACGSPRCRRWPRHIAQGAVAGIVPDVLHAHDWQAGLAPPICTTAAGGVPGTVMTVHNLAFQGRFRPACWPRWACRRKRSASTASSATATSASSRQACSLPTGSPPSPPPTPPRSARPRAAWGWTACCAPGLRCCAAS